MGEANLRFARGEWDDAVKLCMEVVRQVCIFLSFFNQCRWNKPMTPLGRFL